MGIKTAISKYRYFSLIKLKKCSWSRVLKGALRAHSCERQTFNLGG
jgi:hypothetical protein